MMPAVVDSGAGPTALTVDSAGVPLYVEVSGSGAPILLVHGWAMDHRVFRYQVATLASHFRVIVFDRRGFGRSGGEPDLRRETHDIDAIADELIGEPFHLLGMSQGGRIALRYAASRPGRLRSLILQGPAIDGQHVDGPEEERIPVADYVELARAGRMDEVRRRWRRHPMMAVDESQDDTVRLLDEMLADYRGEDLVHYRPEAYSWGEDVLAELAMAEMPVLILTGAQETEARRRLSALLARSIPGAREVLLAHSGHLSNLTEPAEYNRAVLEFCNALEAPRRD